MGTSNAKYMSSDTSDTEPEYEDCQQFVAKEEVPVAEESIGEEVDALLRISASLPNAKMVLNPDKVSELEDELDIQDIVSMVYLLFEETDYALQMLVLLLNGGNKKILSDWARHNDRKGINWQNKFIEALCIIKHYYILKTLGYQKLNVISHFLPNQITTLHVNKLKKSVYQICDSFGPQETASFLNHARDHYRRRQISFDEYGHDYLEIYFLKWESMRTLDWNDIKNILKNMQQNQLYERLDSILSEVSGLEPQEKLSELSITERKTTVTSFEIPQNSLELREVAAAFDKNSPQSRIRKPSSTSIDNNRPLESTPNDFAGFHHNIKSRLDRDNVQIEQVDQSDGRYPVDSENPGIVLIINQETFYTEINKEYKHLLVPEDMKLKKREGTDVDQKRLEEVFNSFGFKVIVKNNLGHRDILKEIKNAVNLVTKESSLLICVMSHGEEGKVYGTNSCYVEISKIEEIMSTNNQQNLKGKPKVLILQSCQGRECQTLDETDEKNAFETDGPQATRREYRDMFIFWATVPGYAAVRHNRTGSWFIQAFCGNMLKYGNSHHFADICIRTTGDVTKEKWKSENEIRIMTPQIATTFTKDFVLPPLKRN